MWRPDFYCRKQSGVWSVGRLYNDGRIDSWSKKIVLLQPLPERLTIADLEIDTESHWTIIFEYIFNLNLRDFSEPQYVLGFTLSGKPVEATAIKFGEKYFSPLIRQNTPFQVSHTVAFEPLMTFYDEHNRPLCIADID